MTTLLYVDDEETIGRSIARWFGRRGHTVHLAHSVAEARERLLEHEPDALVIDVWLGEESGFELLGWVEDQLPHLASRITFVSGELADSATAERVWRSLGRPVLQKPFELSRLEQLVGAAQPAPGVERPTDA